MGSHVETARNVKDACIETRDRIPHRSCLHLQARVPHQHRHSPRHARSLYRPVLPLPGADWSGALHPVEKPSVFFPSAQSLAFRP